MFTFTNIDQQLKNTSTASNASNYCKLNDHLSAKVWSVVYLAYGFKYSLPYLWVSACNII